MTIRSPRSTASTIEEADLADRVLLCVPRGGLNDTLCQIEKCWRYAAQFDRQLIIDTRRSGLMGQFSDYFSILEKDTQVLNTLEHHHLTLLGARDCFPTELRGRLTTYTTTPTQGEAKTTYCDRESGAPVTFDFSADYPQDVLIHEQSGGGELSFSLLSKLVLADGVLPTIHERLSALPRDYLGVHIRNTDLKTDYETFFREIYPSTIEKTVLVCSDDPNVITCARRLLDRSEVITTGGVQISLNALNGLPLHRSIKLLSDRDKRAQTLNLLVDLIALGLAKDVLTTKCSNKDGYSGFSNLASHLCMSRPLLGSLLSSSVTLPLKQARILVRTQAEEVARRAHLEAYVKQQRQRVLKLQDQLANCDRALTAMRRSWSWRITAPIRVIRALISRARQ